MSRRSVISNGWIVLAAVLTLLAATSLAVTAVRARSNGCAFDDGVAYCRMALGKLSTLPWSRRVAVPTLVSWLPSDWSVVLRFRLVALIASSGVTVGTALLTLRLMRHRVAPRVAYPAALVAAALVAICPHLFRLALTAPVLVDQAALFVGLLWCLLAIAQSKWLRWLSPLVILILVPTRESWVLPLLLAAATMWWTRQRALAAATLVATLAAGAFTVSRPHSTAGRWGRFSSVTQVLHDGRVALTHPDHAVWAVLFGIGLVTALALLVFTNRQRLRGPAGIVFVVACAHVAQGTLGGTDVSRYAAQALPFALALALLTVVELGSSRAFWAFTLLAGATVALWQPFRVPARGLTAYEAMYYPGHAAGLIATAGLALISATLVWVLRDRESKVATAGGNAPVALAGHRSSEA